MHKYSMYLFNKPTSHAYHGSNLAISTSETMALRHYTNLIIIIIIIIIVLTKDLKIWRRSISYRLDILYETNSVKAIIYCKY